MATILPFPTQTRTAPKRAESDQAGHPRMEAEILIFSGVRIERIKTEPAAGKMNYPPLVRSQNDTHFKHQG